MANASVRSFFRALLILATILFVWFASMAAVMRFSNIAPAALVVVRNDRILEKLPPEIKVLRGGEFTMVFFSEKPDYVSDLYAAGAILVLPALRNGCVVLSNKPI